MKGVGGVWRMAGKLVREGLPEKGTFEQRPAGGEGLENLWRRGISSKGNSRCKGPEAGLNMVYSRHSERVTVSKRRVGDEDGMVTRPHPVKPHWLWGSL